MNELFTATCARLVSERAQLLQHVNQLNDQADEITREREKIQSEINGLSRAIAIIEKSEPTPVEKAGPGRLNIAEAVIADLTDAPVARSLYDICATVGRKPSQIKPALRRLLDDGRVLVTGSGCYLIAARPAMIA